MRFQGRYAAVCVVVLAAVGVAGCGGSSGSGGTGGPTSVGQSFTQQAAPTRTVTRSASSVAKVAAPASTTSASASACVALKSQWAATEGDLRRLDLGAAAHGWDGIAREFAVLGLSKEAALSGDVAKVLVGVGANPDALTPHVIAIVKRSISILRVEASASCGQLP